MKFCMVTTFYPPLNFGGDGIYVEALSRALVERGHEVTVVHCADAYRLTGGPHDATASEVTQDGIRVHRLHSRLGFLSPLLTQQSGRPMLKARSIAAILAQGFDVINFHNISLVGGPAVLGLPAHGALKLYTLHEHWLLCSTHIFWKNRRQPCDRRQCLQCSIRSGTPPQLWRLTDLIARSVRHVDALIAPSEFTARLHREAGLPVPIVVNPHFARISPEGLGVRSAAAKELAPGATDTSREPYFLYAGRLTASKGIEPLLYQFAAQPHLRLRVAGGGELRDSLVARFGHLPNIRFLGAVDAARLASEYSGAIALILPSLAPETFGLTVVEAMAFGTPSVVRDAGGCREIIDASGAGFVFERFEELPELLGRLQNDTGLRQTLAARARTAYRARYNVERHLSDYLALIERLSRDRPRRDLQ
jgi:glycosyltransferase involved in cell wall biosynthesis